jgi:ABC-type polysaccharide/polyol phosphate transport system ATPase subunit
MDFFVNFELNENFEETIKSRFRDEFSYASFSEGEKSRIDLALLFTWRSIAKLRNSASTNLLILDEVLSVGDEGFKNKCKQRMDQFWDDHSTVLVVSHDLEFVKQSCQRGILLKKGKIIFIGDADEAVKYYVKQI